jgi:hypothetical protein
MFFWNIGLFLCWKEQDVPITWASLCQSPQDVPSTWTTLCQSPQDVPISWTSLRRSGLLMTFVPTPCQSSEPPGGAFE